MSVSECDDLIQSLARESENFFRWLMRFAPGAGGSHCLAAVSLRVE